MFPVAITSEVYGDTIAIAESICETSILVEMCYRPPLGTVVGVTFVNYDDPAAAMHLRAESLGTVEGRVVLRFLAIVDRDLERAVS